MSAYDNVRAALANLETAEMELHSAMRYHVSPVGSERNESEPKVEVERVAPQASAKVVPITAASGLTAQVEAAVKAAGASLGESDKAQLAELEAKLKGLRGKSEQRVASAWERLGRPHEEYEPPTATYLRLRLAMLDS